MKRILTLALAAGCLFALHVPGAEAQVRNEPSVGQMGSQFSRDMGRGWRNTRAKVRRGVIGKQARSTSRQVGATVRGQGRARPAQPYRAQRRIKP